jgi:hypothetical protein
VLPLEISAGIAVTLEPGVQPDQLDSEELAGLLEK